MSIKVSKKEFPLKPENVSVIGGDQENYKIQIAYNICESNISPISIPIFDDHGKIEYKIVDKGYIADIINVIIPKKSKINRNSLINGIIRETYSESEELSILRHHSANPENYIDEWNNYNNICENAKKMISEALA